MTPDNWTDEELRRLVEGRGWGESFESIGHNIGRTKNACIGNAAPLRRGIGQARGVEMTRKPSPQQSQHYRLPEGNVAIAFSGGRTSAYMLHQILEANGDLPERVVVSFQNTGREMPETLDFVQECSDRWGVKVVWLEYRPHKPLYEVVSHNSASRNGEPFTALIQKRKYLPNNQMRFCTIEMKILAARRYARSLGWDEWTVARGIRADEAHRATQTDDKRITNWHPLNDAGVSKREILDWWSRQPFDLRVPEGRGNCDGCFLKSEANLAALARDYPERHQWWQEMEDMASDWTLGNGAKFRKEYSRRELRWMVDNQGDWIFDAEGALCQADDGECIA